MTNEIRERDAMPLSSEWPRSHLEDIRYHTEHLMGVGS